MFGGSNTVMSKGLRFGVENELKKHYNDFELISYALGSSTSLQSLYELIRHKDKICNSDFIITESNLNEINNSCNRTQQPITIIEQNILYYYTELSKLNAKVVVLIMPIDIFNDEKCDLINNMHIYCANHYGFNIVNIYDYYKKHNLKEFSNFFGLHQMNSLMCNIGEQIVKNFFIYNKHNNTNQLVDKNFLIIKPNELSDFKDANFNISNSLYKEQIFRLNSEIGKLNFLPKHKDYYLLGMHSWNSGECLTQFQYDTYSSININNELVKEVAHLNQFNDFFNPIKIEDNSFIEFNKYLEKTEMSEAVYSEHSVAKKINYLDLISLFCVDSLNLNTYNIIKDKYKNIRLKSNLDFTCILPDISFSVNAIREYSSTVLEKKIDEIKQQSELKFNLLYEFLRIFNVNPIRDKVKIQQSSYSKFSKKNEEYNPIKCEYINNDFTFHTKNELNPWWEIEFEKFTEISLIYIQNRLKWCRDRMNKIKVEYYSLNGWQEIDREDFSLLYGNDNNLDGIFIDFVGFKESQNKNILQKTKMSCIAKKIKISIVGITCLHLGYIGIFKK